MQRLEDGSCQRDHVLSLFKQTGEYPTGWEPVLCPYELQYLWAHWCSMNGRRTGNGFGVNPIPDEGVTAWQQRRGIVLTPLENEVIDALERFYFICQPKPKK